MGPNPEPREAQRAGGVTGRPRSNHPQASPARGYSVSLSTLQRIIPYLIAYQRHHQAILTSPVNQALGPVVSPPTAESNPSAPGYGLANR